MITGVFRRWFGYYRRRRVLLPSTVTAAQDLFDASVTADINQTSSLTTEIRFATTVSIAIVANIELTTEIIMAGAQDAVINAAAEFTIFADEFVANALCSITAAAELSTEIKFDAIAGSVVTAAAAVTTEIRFGVTVAAIVTVSGILIVGLPIFNTVSIIIYFPVKQEHDIKFAVKQNEKRYFSPKHTVGVKF